MLNLLKVPMQEWIHHQGTEKPYQLKTLMHFSLSFFPQVEEEIYCQIHQIHEQNQQHVAFHPKEANFKRKSYQLATHSSIEINRAILVEPNDTNDECICQIKQSGQ